MKKLKLFPFMLLPLALSSCGQNKFIGTYSFQLGRDSGTHLGVFATLTKKDYQIERKEEGKEPETITLGKTMKLRLKFGGTKMGGFLDDLDIDDVTISAYYNIGKSLGGELGNVLNFGFNIKEVLEEILPTPPNTDTTTDPIISRDGETPSECGEGGESGEGGEAGEGEDPADPIPEEYFDITPEDTAKFVYTTISKTTLVFNIPVSFDDLEFQLYWYGLDLSNLSAEGLVEHDVGTHPTAEDIAAINETYPATHENKQFRDYHTLSLALTRK